jgi:hypothetical protein
VASGHGGEAKNQKGIMTEQNAEKDSKNEQGTRRSKKEK